ncbi:hypothetical protein MJO29_004092 [Puccinia striiformis f. sp. tritici]|nr:hypothetical protein MJO29_004092 [Puccinia striiformis f. sp. tritici]
MWIGLCTLPLFLLVTGVRSYDRAQIDECFEKKIYRECVKEYGQWKHLPRATLVDFISASTDTQHALYQPPIAKISHWKNLAIVALSPAFVINVHRWSTAKTGLGCTGVPAPEKPLGGCGAVSGEYYQACLDKYDPGCKYVPIDDYQNCCTGEIEPIKLHLNIQVTRRKPASYLADGKLSAKGTDSPRGRLGAFLPFLCSDLSYHS